MPTTDYKTPQLDLTVSALPVTLESDSPAVSKQLASGAGLIIAVTNRETSGTGAAAFSLWDGAGIGTQRLMTFGLLANSSDPFAPASPGILFRTGIFLEVRSGSCVVTVTYVPLALGSGGYA